MAFQPVPKGAVASIQYTCNGNPMANVLNFEKTGASYNQSDIDNLALAVAAWALGEYFPLLNVATTGLQVVVRGLAAINDYAATEDLTSGAGTGSGNPVSNQVAYVVKFLSGLTGRSARGRFYTGGFGVSALDTNERFVTTTFRDFIVGAMEELPDAVGAAGWTHCILSRYTGGVKRASGVLFPVTNYTVTDLKTDTVRRRAK